MQNRLTAEARKDIAEILGRRANEVAAFLENYRKDAGHFGSVELALTREVSRLRVLEAAVTLDEDPPDYDQVITTAGLGHFLAPEYKESAKLLRTLCELARTL